MQIRPCIDIHNGKVKQIIGSTLRDRSGGAEGTASENFVADKDASWYASVYKEMALPGGHIILLNSVKEEKAIARILIRLLALWQHSPAACRSAEGSRQRLQSPFWTQAPPM